MLITTPGRIRHQSQSLSANKEKKFGEKPERFLSFLRIQSKEVLEEMALIPLTAAFRQDFVVQLIPVEDTDTMEVVAQKVAAHAVDLRVAPKEVPMLVIFEGKSLPPEDTVASAGIGPMDFIEVRYADEHE